MCGGALLSFRIFPDLMGAVGFVPAALALAIALVVLVVSEVRLIFEL